MNTPRFASGGLVPGAQPILPALFQGCGGIPLTEAQRVALTALAQPGVVSARVLSGPALEAVSAQE